MTPGVFGEGDHVARAALQAARDLPLVHPLHRRQALRSRVELQQKIAKSLQPGEAADEALKKRVMDPGIFLFSGRIAMARTKYAEAIDYFQRAADQNPVFFEAYAEMGNAYFQMKQIKNSTQAYEKAVALNPSHIETLKTLASVYLVNMDDPQRARELLQHALALNPNAKDAKDLKELILELSPENQK